MSRVKERSEVADIDEFPFSSKKKTLVNILKSYLGISVLFLPSVFRDSGVILVSIMYIVAYLLSTRMMLLLVDIKNKIVSDRAAEDLEPECGNKVTGFDDIANLSTGDWPIKAKRYSTITYYDIGYAAMGTFGGAVVDICLICSHVGFALTSHIFSAGILNSFVPSVKEIYWMCLLVIPLIILCNIRHLKFFAFVSLASLAMFIGGYVCILSALPEKHAPSEQINYYDASFINFFSTLSTVFYSFEGVGMVLPIEQSMKKKPSFMWLYYVGLLLVTVVYVLFGSLGYISYGNSVADNIIQNYVSRKKNSMLPGVIEVGFMLGSLGTYGLLMYPVSERIDRVFDKYKCIRKFRKPREFIVRMSLVLLTLVLGTLLKGFRVVVNFVGGFLATMLMYILPASFYIILVIYPNIRKKREEKHLTFVDIMSLVGGVFALMLGIAANILCTFVSIKKTFFN
ncbi:uncharacterized protein LOC126329077 [Schistocerca gregaria]|uniref:uncharacterized protein LOC126329077 n=1 Tax=Schistocerca gregaria TaxID=7010 RepID=UPI00211E2F2A|nr:uncharacterized protein LOC126329077 [Schistocerca gregaria]